MLFTLKIERTSGKTKMAAPMEHVRIQSQPQPTPTATQLQNEADPINRTRQLIPQLKESLAVRKIYRIPGNARERAIQYTIFSSHEPKLRPGIGWYQLC